MSSKRSFRGTLSLFLLCLAVTSATAHRAKSGLTTIEFNATSGLLEIVHSLHWHDAELGLAEVTGDPQLSLVALEARARLALYVEERFALADGKSGEKLPLVLVGAELSGDYVLIYQELDSALPALLAVRHDVLRDVIPEQVNQLNLLLGDAVQTLTFSGDDGWKTIVVRQ
ncbi:MAG: hypothetical protein OEW68_06305 [Gammaproteobacteria bacterium]|nr:hypothetical protein [Gammaproteobacteria bacterium]MDH4314437.1 hypothetical protein [Gammaproteobacteria bacterium]MDH5213286.1 hypothetical protein [Gammaproteobacteria bacterium]MDH5502049.1 hypothetical protein [Gammaproteobacteria bacterium]